MATTGQNDDDLIILSDNIDTSFDGNPVIPQNIDFDDNNSVISFDTPNLNGDAILEIGTKQEITPVIKAQETNNQSEFNSTLDLAETDSSLLVSEQIDSTTNKLNPEQNLNSSINNLFKDVDLGESSTANNNTLDLSISQDIKQENDSIGDMNAILNNTIDKLKLRQLGIESQKSTKIITINDLESKIKELREQVTGLKKEIVFLDEENIKIEINVGNLESMKLGKPTKGTTTKTREHNTKKLVKEVKALPQKS